MKLLDGIVGNGNVTYAGGDYQLCPVLAESGGGESLRHNQS